MPRPARWIVIDRCDERKIHLHVLQFGLQQLGLDGVKGAGEVKEQDADSSVGSIQGGVGFLQQVGGGERWCPEVVARRGLLGELESNLLKNRLHLPSGSQ